MTIALIIIIVAIIGILFWALMGGRSDTGNKDEVDNDDPSKTFRRRASDKAIEEEFPDDSPHYNRRKSDRLSDDDFSEDLSSFKLPYLADGIIPESSRFRIYRRTLLNSEVYASKGDFTTAISLYEGVRTRINDAEVRSKIDANIDYLRQYKERKERRDQQKKDEAAHLVLENDHTEAINTRELKITFDGDVPDSFSFDSIPEQLNLGVNDQSRDAGALPGETASRIMDELNNFKDDLSNVKTQLMSMQGPAGAQQTQTVVDESRIAGEIESLKDRVEKLDTIENLSNEDIQQLQNIADSVGAASEGLDAAGDIANLKEELTQLNKIIQEVATRSIPETDKKPALTEAKFDSQKPLQIDAQPILEILEKIPQIQAPEPTSIKEPRSDISATEMEMKSGSDAGATGEAAAAQAVPGAGAVTQETSSPGKSDVETVKADPGAPAQSQQAVPGTGQGPVSESAPSERVIERDRAPYEEEDDGFELLSDFIHDKDDDSLSDDEIFEKILKEGEDNTREQFEIIGEKKDSVLEYSVSDEQFVQKQREDESFYRKVLKTDKRKKRELPILKVTYDFNKLPDELGLSREKNLMEYSFYKYKPLLEKANEYLNKRKVRDAINYYKVVMGQNIPPEFKAMIRKNLNDLNEYLEKYLTGD